ncbi:unnamed protein product [Musa acuminata var. zebrina]
MEFWGLDGQNFPERKQERRHHYQQQHHHHMLPDDHQQHQGKWGQEKRDKDLDPRRTRFRQLQRQPRESEGGEEEEEEQSRQKAVAVAAQVQATEGHRLHHLHRHNQQTRSRGLAFSSIATASSSEYAQFSERMGEHHSHHGSLGLHQLALHHHQQQQQREQRAQTHSRLGRLRAAGGEIVEVQGGHIVRSTGRKDRHSKVCTAKGPRDRRVRLSAHTAIQFYDVQDRLGYDRPSKAVDWLIKNAKAAIDQLAELPAAWIPTAAVTADAAATSTSCAPPSSRSPATEHPSGESSKKLIPVSMPDFPTAFSFGGPKGTGGSISFLPPSLDSDHIADTIKSFFPMAAAGGTTISPSSIPSIGFHNYPSDLLSRTSGRTQDLRLSLQSFQDSVFHNAQSDQQHHSPTPAHRSLLVGSSHLGFDAASPGWVEQNQRVSEWNVAETSGGAGLYGFAFNVPPLQAVPLHSVLGPSQFLTQRGPLQSSNSPSVRGWADPVAPTSEFHMQPVLHPSAASIGFTSEADFSGFHVPARIQGEEEHGDVPDKPPSATSASCQ